MAAIELDRALGANHSSECRSLCAWITDDKYVTAMGGAICLQAADDSQEPQQFLPGAFNMKCSCLAVGNREGSGLVAAGFVGDQADVLVWRDGELVSRLEEHDEAVTCLAFTCDDRFVVSTGGMGDQRLFVWDCDKGLAVTCRSLATLVPVKAVVQGGFVKDVKRRNTSIYQLASCGGRNVTVWEFNDEAQSIAPVSISPSGKQTRSFECLCFSADYELLFVGTSSGDIAVVKMRNRVVQGFSEPVGAGGIFSLAYVAPAGESPVVLAASGDGSITLFSCVLTELRQLKRVVMDSGAVVGLSVGRKGQLLCASTTGTTWLLWPAKDMAHALVQENTVAPLEAVAYPMPDVSTEFAVGDASGVVTLWSCDALSSNGRFVVTGGGEGEVRVWEMKSKEMVCGLKEHTSRVNALKLFSNDQYCVSGSRDRCLLTFDLRAEKRITCHRERHGGIDCLAVGSDDNIVVTGGKEKHLTFWDLRQPEPIRVVSAGPGDELRALSYYDDGKGGLLASGGTGNIVKLWDMGSGRLVCSHSEEPRHSACIKDLSFSPDGKQLISVGFIEAISRRNPRLSQEWNLSPERLAESPSELPAKRRRSSEVSYIDLMDATQKDMRTPPQRESEGQQHSPARPSAAAAAPEDAGCIECAICLCPAEAGAMVGTLHAGPSTSKPSCPHRFCFDCIFKWSKATNLCPLCKGRFGCIRKHKVVHGDTTRPIEGPLGLVRVKKKDMRPEDFVTPPGGDADLRQLYNDLVCEVCREGTAENALLICEMCERGYHTFCLRPRLTTVPLDDWFCLDCQQAILDSQETSPPIRRSLRLQRLSSTSGSSARPIECESSSSSSTSSSSSSSVTEEQSPIARRTRSSLGDGLPARAPVDRRNPQPVAVSPLKTSFGLTYDDNPGSISSVRLSRGNGRTIVLDASQGIPDDRPRGEDRRRRSWEEASRSGSERGSRRTAEGLNTRMLRAAHMDLSPPAVKRLRTCAGLDPNLAEECKRKPVPADALTNSLAFMQVDVDNYSAAPRACDPIQNGEVPVIRMFGVTAAGNSLMCHIHGFLPYFYCPRPDQTVDCERFQARLESALRGSQTASGTRCKQLVTGVEIVVRENLMGWTGRNTASEYFRVTVALPKFISTSRGVLERGIPVLQGDALWSCTTFETNIPYPLRFMIDNDIGGGSWVELPAGAYTPRTDSERVSTCQIEVDVPDYRQIIGHMAEGDWMALAPLRILSFDIECVSEHGKGFPTPDVAPVIQIAAVMQEGTEQKHKIVWTLDTCADIADATVVSFESERDLLSNFQQVVVLACRYMVLVDPDVITGYNIINFDLPYLLDRSAHLKVHPPFEYLGRLKGVASKVKDSVFESRALGRRENKDINIEGRVQFDMLIVMQREHKLRSYSLNAVSAEFLGEQKEDVHYSIIGDLQKGTPETRKRLAVYCLKDSLLPLRLMNKLVCMYNYTEMARVTGVPINYLLTRGQMIKVASQLFRKARSHGYVIPAQKSPPGGEFEGATVLDPTTGFYTNPIATLDFASLYPSIMQAHNLCYSTLVQPSVAQREGLTEGEEGDVTRTPCGHLFVKQGVRKGLLPMVLEELLQARKRAKKEMAQATDPLKKMVLNGRQLALKVSANSVYGFTGATVGMMPCLEISSSVTAFGRQMIEHTKTLVEQKYRVENGYAHDASVIYGDTDSVFVKFGCDTVEEAMKLGQEAAAYVSTTFIDPIKLEFEKVYFPYLLMNKKRYAGLYWTNPVKADKLDAKGIETVRRDNCELVKVVVENTLNIILKESSLDRAIAFIRKTLSELLQNKVDMSMLVISKSLAKGMEDGAYAAKQAHVELAKRMAQRDPGNAPAIGDRIQYVIIKAPKGVAQYEKAEDPLYRNNIPVDGQHYIDHQLKQPLMRIFENILPNAESVLFSGEHMRKVFQSAPSATGGLSMFLKKTHKCLSCKAVLKDGHGGALCQHCKNAKEGQVVIEKTNELRALEVQFSRLWSECQRCQGSVEQDVICTSRDCPVFYRRAKVRKDAARAADAVSRLREAIDW
ncbi:DNA-directed DNA polymerase delta [Perkinsus olseni]|uniref:DNA polymerase delta catalytic subunit n=1 Tax=Perkinsus olseni TaxID=32597 RepID=A0A7J6PH12_PEROL|nr:DNA-directed DNA polymerase delta [Perkinsus olseni]